MHAHHHHIFVIRTVENSDISTCRQRLHRAPEEIVIHFLAGRLLEHVHFGVERIHARHDVIDRAVLAGRVHALKNQQQRALVLRI